MSARTIAICGGIGSGKSVVARMVSAMGYHVYDTDLHARRIMDTDEGIIRSIAKEISESAVSGGMIDRRRLSEIVFNDAAALMRLNKIVHGAVRADFISYRDSQNTGVVFMETAILFESGFHTLADAVWEVVAPEEVRIERVMRRNGLSRREVEIRIEAQSSGAVEHRHPKMDYIFNDGIEPLLPRVTTLLQNL